LHENAPKANTQFAGAGQRENPREWKQTGALPGTVDGGGHGLRKTKPRAVSGEEDRERTGRAAGLPAASEVA